MACVVEVHVQILASGTNSLGHQAAALAVGVLVDDGARALAGVHHHGWHRYEVVLLDELFRVYQLQGLICLRVAFFMILTCVWSFAFFS